MVVVVQPIHTHTLTDTSLEKISSKDIIRSNRKAVAMDGMPTDGMADPINGNHFHSLAIAMPLPKCHPARHATTTSCLSTDPVAGRTHQLTIPTDLDVARLSFDFVDVWWGGSCYWPSFPSFFLLFGIKKSPARPSRKPNKGPRNKTEI